MKVDGVRRCVPHFSDTLLFRFVSSGCDSLHLFVNEAGALSVRTLGNCVLPYAMFKDGFTGEVNFEKSSSCVFLTIVPMSSGVPDVGNFLELAAAEAALASASPSAPPLSSGQQTPMEVATYSRGAHEVEPWVSAVVAGVSIPKFTSTSATIEELDGHKMMTSGVPASLSLSSAAWRLRYQSRRASKSRP